MYLSCSIPYSTSSNYPQCTGTYQQESTLDDNNNYMTCDVEFITNGGGWVNCPSTAQPKTGAELSENDYLFELDTYTDISGYLRNPTNFTSSLYVNSEPPTNDQSYSLNGDLLEVLLYATLSFFVIGLSTGGFISWMRKLGHK